MPLAALDELLEYAEKKEREKDLYPLWLAHYTISALTGVEPMPYDELINNVAENKVTAVKSNKTAQEIIDKFTPIVEADLNRGGV